MPSKAIGSFFSSLLGSDIEFRYTVHQDWSASIGFTLFGKLYSFSCTRWKGVAAQTKFLGLFFRARERDSEVHGAVNVGENDLLNFNINDEQRVAIIVQACRDVITTLHMILQNFERSVLDYAVWYREKHPETNTYGELITLVCCHCIVHTDFMSPNLMYDLIQFPDEQLGIIA